MRYRVVLGYRPARSGTLARMAHLVWDWNGTLLDDLTLTVEATNASLAVLGGVAVTVDEHQRTFRRPVIDYYSYALGWTLTAAEFRLLDEAFHVVYQEGLVGCQLAPDAPDALAAWSGTQSLLSMWSHSYLTREVRRRGLTGWLSRVDGKLTGVGEAPPLGDRKAAYLARHLAALGVAPHDCVLIGDSIDDADAATTVGARCVLYAGGITDRERLAATGHPVAASLVQAITIAGTPAPRAPSDAAHRRVADRAS